MMRTFLSLGTVVCLALAAACNAKIADVGSDGADAGYEATAEGTTGWEADASTYPPGDASADFDGGTVYPGDDASFGDGGCPPPPPPPCGCPEADAGFPDDGFADAGFPDDGFADASVSIDAGAPSPKP